MAMSVDDGLAIQLRQRNQVLIILKELTQQHGLPRKPLGALVVGKQVAEFVAENGHAARFQSNNRDSSLNFRRQYVEDLQQQVFRSVEHAEIVERTPTSESATRQFDAEAGALKH